MEVKSYSIYLFPIQGFPKGMYSTEVFLDIFLKINTLQYSLTTLKFISGINSLSVELTSNCDIHKFFRCESSILFD